MIYTILVVDDEIYSFERYRKALEAYTVLQVVHAQHSKDALQKLSSYKPSLIILDQVFLAENVGVQNLFGRDMKGKLIYHHPETDPANIREDEGRQGLYILESLKHSGYYSPVIFVTQYTDTQVGVDAIRGGAKDYVSKDRIPGEIVPLLEKHLNVTLRTLQEEVQELLKEHEIKSKQDFEMLSTYLKTEAQKVRRLAKSFIKDVVRKLPKPSPTLGDLISVVDEMKTNSTWQCEVVNPEELRHWVETEWYDLGRKWKYMDYIGYNKVRYAFRGEIVGNPSVLKIVCPRFAASRVDFDQEANSYPCSQRVLDLQVFPLKTGDPYWEGQYVVAYFEAAPQSPTLQEYIHLEVPITSDRVQNILNNISNVIHMYPNGHGMLGLDCIYIRDDGTLQIGDVSLWESIDPSKRDKLLGLTAPERKTRDIQMLGRIADALCTGYPGGLQKLKSKHPFWKFLEECEAGTWKLGKPIPAPPAESIFLHGGSFESDLEREFFYPIKKKILESEIRAIVLVNYRLHLHQIDPNEADFLIILARKAFWIDIKGIRYLKDDFLSKLTKIKTNLLGLFSELGIDRFIETYYVMSAQELDKLFRTKIDLTTEEKKCFLTIEEFIERLKPDGPEVQISFNPQNILGLLRPKLVRTSESIFESSQSFAEIFGKSEAVSNQPIFLTSKFYIRRYSIGDVSDAWVDATQVESFVKKALIEQSYEQELQSPHILLPEKVILVSRDSQLLSGDDLRRLRWLYKGYRLYGGGGCTGFQLLTESLEQLDNANRRQLMVHYLIGLKDLLIKSIGCELHLIRPRMDSLKVFLWPNKVHGTLEVFEGADSPTCDDVLLIFDILGIGDFRDRISKKPSALLPRVLEEILREEAQSDKLSKMAEALERIANSTKEQQGIANLEQPVKPQKLYVGNLDPSLTKEEVRREFEIYGTVVRVSLPIDYNSGQRRTYGFVTMATREQAELARQSLEGKYLKGRMLKVRFEKVPNAQK
jgi:DNA-binding NarL/FixJ family response regulator